MSIKSINLSKAFVWASFAEAVAKLLPYLCISILTRSLSESNAKTFTTYFGMIALVSIAFDLSMRSSLKVEILREPTKGIDLLQGNLFVIIVSTTVVTSVLLVCWFLEIFRDYQPILFTLSLAASSFAVMEGVLSILIARQQIKLHSIFYAVRATIPILLFVLISRFHDEFQVYLLLVFLVNVICLLILKIRLNLSFRPSFKFTRHLWAGVAILPATVSAFLLTYCDRFFLEAYVSDRELISYNLAYLVGSLVFPIAAVVNRVTQARLIRLTIEGSWEQLVSSWTKITGLYLFSGLGLFVVSPYLILVLGSDRYEPGPLVILLVCLGSLFYALYTMILNSIIAGKNKLYFALPAIGAAILNLILNAILIPTHGSLGAALATALAYFFELLAAGTLLYRLSQSKGPLPNSLSN